MGQLGMILTGFFDTIMVGDLGYEELAAAGVSNSIFFFAAVFPIGVTMAFATIVGILQGKGKTSSYRLLTRDSFIVTMGLSVLASIVIFISIQYFHVFGQTDEVSQLSKPYLSLLMWSLTPMLIFFFAKNICDGFSYTEGGMIITSIALILNVFLNWVFIYGNLGSSAYGLDGAGYATIISRLFLAVSMLWMLFGSSKTPLIFRNFINSFRESNRISFYKKIRQLGLPTGLQYFLEIAAFAAAAILAGTLGSQELAAHNLAITLASVTYMFAGGISAGASICVAKANGTGDISGIKKYGQSGHILGLGVMLFFAGIFFIFNKTLAGLFTEDLEVITLGSELLVLAAIFQLGDGLQAVSVGLLRGLEDTVLPSVFIFIAYWVIAMPFGYWLAYSSGPNYWFTGVHGIWIGLSIGLTLSAIALTFRFYHLLRTK